MRYQYEIVVDKAIKKNYHITDWRSVNKREGSVMRIVKDADERKNEILDTAKILFSQKGFDGTSISDIIDKVGVARGTVY